VSDQIQNLITNLGVLLVAVLPIIALRFKWSDDQTGQMKKYIIEIVAAVALVAGSMFAVWNARHAANVAQANRIAAVQAAAQHPPEQRPALMRSMGVPE
jgi:heme/copper-type cytochrome/quinol oxidase subunit 4